ASVFDPELTPSARMLAEMRENDEGFFHHAQRMSKYHYHYYKTHDLPEDKIRFFEDAAKKSIEKQHQIEVEDHISFDEFLQNYFDEE
ncbi:MAG: glutamate--cysteine ligase, partial [Gammaproteobacteria bacterium]|nr:glutamate--cysteine ligase [Gammaproteobacteria bacterium]